MRTHWLPVLMLVALVSFGAESGGRDDEFMELYYFPPQDGGTGALMPRSVELLDSLHTLPRRVDVWPKEKSSSGEKDPASGRTSDWIVVPVDGVASPLERAGALAAAGRVEEAAAAYAEAAEDGGAGAHAAVMGGICELRRGDTEGAARLMSRAASRREEIQDWHNWTTKMHELTSDIEKLEADQ